MDRRHFLKGVSGGIAAATFCRWDSEIFAMTQERPNFLYVFPDQFRRMSMGFMGEDPVVTPHLDRFAGEGLVLTRAVSNYPVCSPYRAMLMTGKFPAQNGVLANCTSARTPFGNFLKASDVCLTDVLHNAGYHVGYIGKWHLDGPEPTPEGAPVVWDAYTPPGPKRHSVDFWYAYGTFNDHFHPHYWTGDADEGHPLEIDQWSPEHEVDVAIQYLRNEGGRHRDPDKPFALVMSMNPPHPPYNKVPERYRAVYAGKRAEDLLVRPNVDVTSENGRTALRSVADYFASVTGVDDQFGRLLKCLDETGLADNTVVVFTSDHGEMMGSHDLMSKNVYYEESFGVPFLIRWPGRIAPGKDDVLLGSPDLMPTLLGLAGLAGHAPEEVQGSDFSALFRGENTTRPEAALYFRMPPGNPGGGIRGLRTQRYTYVAQPGNRETILFDNVADPYQRENLAEKQPELVANLHGMLREQLARIRDPWQA